MSNKKTKRKKRVFIFVIEIIILIILLFVAWRIVIGKNQLAEERGIEKKDKELIIRDIPEKKVKKKKDIDQSSEKEDNNQTNENTYKSNSNKWKESNGNDQQQVMMGEDGQSIVSEGIDSTESQSGEGTSGENTVIIDQNNNNNVDNSPGKDDSSNMSGREKNELEIIPAE